MKYVSAFAVFWWWFFLSSFFLSPAELPVQFVNKQADTNISAYENESVTLCAIVNQERANVRWLKEGRLLNEDNVHISSEGKHHNLTINPLRVSDSGKYICDVNTDEMYFTVAVKGEESTAHRFP